MLSGTKFTGIVFVVGHQKVVVVVVVRKFDFYFNLMEPFVLRNGLLVSCRRIAQYFYRAFIFELLKRIKNS